MGCEAPLTAAVGQLDTAVKLSASAAGGYSSEIKIAADRIAGFAPGRATQPIAIITYVVDTCWFEN